MQAELPLVILVIAAFALAISAVLLLERFGARKRPEVWQAVKSEVGVVAAILGPASLGPRVFAFALLVLGGLALREMMRARRVGRSGRPLAFALLFPGAGAFTAAMVAASGGGRQVLFVYGVTELADVTAYLVGKYRGKTPLAARLSPHKTWEGTLAGLSVAAVSPFLLAAVAPPLSPLGLVLLGLLLGLFGLAGDLIASGVKRRAGLKDFGAAVPGFGGFMDVFDAFFFAAPLYFLLVWSCGLG